MKHVVARFVARCAVALVGVGLTVAALAGCSEREAARSVTQLADPGDAIDQDLMVALAQAKNYHHKAKVYMSDGNLAAATASVRQILSLAFPSGAPEADDVRNDARALLAKLLVSQGQLDEAMRTISEGLAQSQRDSFFVANLFTVQGEIHEARAAAFDAATGSAADPAAGLATGSAIDERRAAIASYDKSIQINERLQKKLMEAQ